MAKKKAKRARPVEIPRTRLAACGYCGKSGRQAEGGETPAGWLEGRRIGAVYCSADCRDDAELNEGRYTDHGLRLRHAYLHEFRQHYFTDAYNAARKRLPKHLRGRVKEYRVELAEDDYGGFVVIPARATGDDPIGIAAWKKNPDQALAFEAAVYCLTALEGGTPGWMRQLDTWARAYAEALGGDPEARRKVEAMRAQCVDAGRARGEQRRIESATRNDELREEFRERVKAMDPRRPLRDRSADAVSALAKKYGYDRPKTMRDRIKPRLQLRQKGTL